MATTRNSKHDETYASVFGEDIPADDTHADPAPTSDQLYDTVFPTNTRET